jgi:hypothetical protein
VTYDWVDVMQEVVGPLHGWQHEFSQPGSNGQPLDDVKSELKLSSE